MTVFGGPYTCVDIIKICHDVMMYINESIMLTFFYFTVLLFTVMCDVWVSICQHIVKRIHDDDYYLFTFIAIFAPT